MSVRLTKLLATKKVEGMTSNASDRFTTEHPTNNQMKGIMMSYGNSTHNRIVCCESCSVILVNGDTTHLDYSGMVEEDIAYILGNVDRVGNCSFIDSWNDGYFDCEICSATEVGGSIFECDTAAD